MSAFSDRVDKLLATVEQNAYGEQRAKTPTSGDSAKSWVAGVTMDGNEGSISTKPKDTPVNSWEDELREWGFDPAIYEVVEPVRVSTWQTYDERQLWAYKAQIRTKQLLTPSELELLTQPVRADKRKPKPRPSGEYVMVVPIGDWQIGKDDGDGLEGTVARIDASITAVLDRVKFLRKSGYNIGTLLVCSLGDLGEGCNGHYEQQSFSVMLDRRDQNKVVRRLARNALMAWATEFENVIVAAVAGNHGENRRGSKSFTSNNDNDDVAVWEAVAETLSVNPDLYGHIKWLLPKGELSIALDVNNVRVGLAHGHQARSGDIGRWWEGQSLGGRPVASADLLLTGHFHHFRCAEVAQGRWHIQVPAQDGGSEWFQESSGRGSTSGQVTLLLGDGKWTELAIV